MLANTGENYYTCAVNDPLPDPLACTIPNAADGDYTVKINASNITGDGPDGILEPASGPQPPTGLVANAGYQKATIAFTPATSGPAATGYEYTVDGGNTWTTLATTNTGGSLLATIDGLTNGVRTNIAVRAITAEGPSDATAPVTITAEGAVFIPTDPSRIYDSRTADGKLAGGTHRTVTVPNTPDGTVAVAYNLTATGMTGPGYLAVSGGDTPAAGTSTINYSAPGQQWANSFATAVDTDGRFTVAATGAATDFVVDITGYYVENAIVRAPDDASAFHPVTPTRAYDSRDIGAGGPLGNGPARRVNVTAGGLVPADAVAVAYTLTETGTTGRGYLAVAPAGGQRPDVSTINWFDINQTTANTAVVAIANGAVDVWAGSSTGGAAQFVIDIVGYYTPVDIDPNGAGYTPVAPVRAFDSRTDTPTGPISGGQMFTNAINVTGVPSTADAFAINLTETGTTATGYLTATPGSTASAPVASTINWYQANQTTANGTVVGPIMTEGDSQPAVRVFAGGGSAQYVLDIAGYYSYLTDNVS